jgi:flagellar FliL protein
MGDEERDDLMDEEEGAASSEPQPGPGRSKIVRILLFVAGGILFIVLVVGISYWVSKSVQESSYEKRQDIIAAPPPPPLNTYELPDFSTTTADAEPHFIKMKIALAYEPNLELQNELIKRRDQIQHVINILLRSKHYEELRTIEDTVSLSEEIKAHINMNLISGKIKEIYFKELLVN